MACCPSGAVGYLEADHKDEGSVRSIDGIAFYQVGSGTSGLLLIPDIWGWNGGRVRALADEFAKKGLSVFIPKILQPPHNGGTDGDACAPDFSPVTNGSELGPLFGGDWHASKVLPKLLAVTKAMKSAGVKKMGVIGVCYGAWAGMYLAKEVELVGCAAAHPSVHIEKMIGGDVAALGKSSKCPWALFPCGDPNAGGDGTMYDEDGELYKALEEKFSGKNVTKRYGKMAHGFWTRGAIKQGFAAGTGSDVEAAVQEQVKDFCEFFCARGLMSRNRAGLPPKLRKPKWTKVATIEPAETLPRGLNLMLKCVKCDKEAEGKWEAVLGDETGVVTFSLRSEVHAELCKPGNSIRVQNARVVMVNGFIRAIIDKWAVMKAADEALNLVPKVDKDVSAIEYELA